MELFARDILAIGMSLAFADSLASDIPAFEERLVAVSAFLLRVVLASLP